MKEKNPLFVLWTAFLFLAVVMIALSMVCSESKADWMEVPRFGGLVTHEGGVSIPLDQAREVDGWFVRNGKLGRDHFTKFRQTPVLTTPTYILGHSATGDALLLYTDNFNRLKGGVIAEVNHITPTRRDSAFTQNTTDSVLHYWEHHNGGGVTDDTVQYWLNFALSTRSSITWGDTSFGVTHFYSNRWILGTRAFSQTDTLPLNPAISTPDVSEGSGTVDFPDTTLVLDGSYIWVYRGDLDSVTNIGTTTTTYPAYADTGRVVNVYESGDSLILVLDPVDSIYTQATEFWVLWDDTLRGTATSASHAQPCSVLSVIEYSTDSMRCIVLADTIRYKGVDHYWDGTVSAATSNMYAIMYKPGAKSFYKSLEQSGKSSTDTLAYLGKVGALHYATLSTRIVTNNGSLSGLNDRITDANIWQISSGASSVSIQDTAYCVLLHYEDDIAGSYDQYFKFLLFDIDTILASEWQTQKYQALYQRPRLTDWAVTTTSANALPYRAGILHRQRSWFTSHGHADSGGWTAYSNLITAAGNYATYPTANKFLFEGSDKNVGLSSLGQTLVEYRRRGIMLVSGFSNADLYAQPAPVGQGVPNHWVIARSVQDNADAICNENGMFLFSGGGLEPLSPQIYEVFVDSINWAAESKPRGAVWDNMYFVSAPLDTFTTNNRIVGLDLETRDAWLMSKPRASSVWNFKDDDGSEELYFGDADSSVIWQLRGATDNLYYVSDWKSGWSDFGDASRQKLVRSYRVDYSAGASGDSLMIDWYTDLTTTAAWSDTIVSTAAGSQTTLRFVPRRVQGKYLSFGVRSADSAMTINRFGFDQVDLGARRK